MSAFSAVFSPGVMRPVSAALRAVAPIAVVPRFALITRYEDVLDVLDRSDEFTVSQIYAPAIDRHDGPFILGMDSGDALDRNIDVLRQAVKCEDRERLRAFAKKEAASLLEQACAVGIIDVVNGYGRLIAARLIGSYFGAPGPDEKTMMRWLRAIFHDIFFNPTNARNVRQQATQSGIALRDYLDHLIAGRTADRSRTNGKTDTVVDRLIALQGPERKWLDNDAVRRNLSGLIVGSVETTSRFVTLAVSELLRRPEMFERARLAAAAGDSEQVRRYAYEAARFNPPTLMILRYCAHDAEVAAGTSRKRTLRAGTNVLLSVISALFDPAAFQAPKTFQIGHDSGKLHFGHGVHSCFGARLNDVVIPELIGALLAIPGLRRAAGAGGIRWDGPFPSRFLLECN